MIWCLTHFYDDSSRNNVGLCLISIIFLTATSTSNAIITYGYRGHDSKTDKTVYMLSEEHKPVTEKDKAQALEFRDMLLEREQKDADNLHILCEVPPAGAEDGPKVTNAAEFFVDFYQLKKTTFENVEKRYLITDVLSLIKATFSTKNFVFVERARREITFKQVIEKFEEFKSEIVAFQDKVKTSQTRNYYEQKVKEAGEYFQQAQELLLTHALENTQTVLAISFALEKKTKELALHYDLRNILFQKILKAFIPLFDLYLYQRVVTLNEKKMMVIAGALHTGELGGLLGYDGWEFTSHAKDFLNPDCMDQQSISQA